MVIILTSGLRATLNVGVQYNVGCHNINIIVSGHAPQAPAHAYQSPQQPYYQYQEYQNQPPFQQPQRAIINGWVWCLAFTAFFCCTLFGILALIFAFAGYDNEKRYDYERARQNAKLAKVFGVLAIVIGASVSGLAVLLFVITAIVGA